MVSNLTVGKKGYEEARPGMLTATAVRAQAVKDALLGAVDRDRHEGVQKVMEAFRLPKTIRAGRGEEGGRGGEQGGHLVPLEELGEAVALAEVAAKGNRNSAPQRRGGVVWSCQAAGEGA